MLRIVYVQGCSSWLIHVDFPKKSKLTFELPLFTNNIPLVTYLELVFTPKQRTKKNFSMNIKLFKGIVHL